MLLGLSILLLGACKKEEERTVQMEVKCHGCYISYNAYRSDGGNLWTYGTTDIVLRDSLVINGDDTTVVTVTDTIPVQATWSQSFTGPVDLANTLLVIHDSEANDTIQASIYQNGGVVTTGTVSEFRGRLNLSY